LFLEYLALLCSIEFRVLQAEHSLPFTNQKVILRQRRLM
jgi:hypothetical protein